MRTIPAPLAIKLQGETTTFAVCFKITRRDGVVLGFTTHDRSIDVGGTTYESVPGVTPSQLQQKADLSIDNLDFKAILDSPSLVREDLLYGAYDYAQMDIFLVDWSDTAAGTIVLSKGTLGEIQTGDVEFSAELRSLSQHLGATHGRTVMLECDVETFGEGRCGLDKLNYAETVSVTSIFEQYKIFDTGTVQPPGYYTHGELRFEAGANMNAEYLIAEHSAGGRIRLAVRTPRGIAVTDQVRLIAGCDRRSSTCRDKFSNCS